MTSLPSGSDSALFRPWRAFALGTLLACSAASPVAIAQIDADGQGPSPADKAAAETLFKEGRALIKNKDYEGAVAKFSESMRLDPQPGTQVNLALAYERLGKHASAWINYIEVATKAERAGQTKRAAVARKRADALEPKLPRLTIDITNEVPGLVITRGPTEIGSAQWGVAVPVDPGPLVITARADGYVTWTKELTITDAPETTQLEIPDLDEEPEAPPPDPEPPVVPMAEPRLVAVPNEDPGAQQRIAGYVVGGFGVASLAVGAIMGGLAIERKSASLDFCPTDDNRCFDEGVSIRRDALTFAHVSTATLIVGGALVAVGLVVVLTAPDADDQDPAEDGVDASLAPIVSPGMAGLMVGGRF